MMGIGKSRHKRIDPFCDEKGFTTTSMVLSLLITLALVFTAAQVYRINALSAEVQDVADAAALSAENQVAEFMIVARFCDATVLSLSLTGIVTCGLGVAALCTPATATLSEGLIDAGKRIIEARNDFSDRAKRALSRLQEALPYFAAACAAGVAAANDSSSGSAKHLGIALLIPDKGKPLTIDIGEKADNLAEDIDDKADDIREKATEAEEAAQEANEAKQRAFMRDCGDNPNYCMYERAKHLAGISEENNPLYSSIDTWSFAVALERAKHYYGSRGENDEPEGNTPRDLARWQLRISFYQYAAGTLDREGYVHENDGLFEANFPHLPKNTNEMRGTDLYTAKDYPITEEPGDGEEAMPIMHAWAGCPGATGPVTTRESIAYMESANLATCPVCEFTPASMGKVAAASTSIDNGFEYHYEAVAREAEVYEEQVKRAEQPRLEVEERAGGLFDKLGEALKETVGKRIEMAPPGSYGAIALVVNLGTASTAGGFASSFVNSPGSLGPRAAIAASTLIDEGSGEGRTAINSLLDGLREDGGTLVGAGGMALDIWSHMLSAYSNGVEALTGGVESGLDQLPLAGASGLGSWAAKAMRSALEGVGLEPAKLEALKPVLINSAHVASRGEGGAVGSLVAIKQRVISHPLYSTDLLSSLLTDAERSAISKVEGLGDSIEIASIELFGSSGPALPITIPLPEPVKQLGIGSIQEIFDRIRSLRAETEEVRSWE